MYTAVIMTGRLARIRDQITQLTGMSTVTWRHSSNSERRWPISQSIWDLPPSSAPRQTLHCT